MNNLLSLLEIKVKEVLHDRKRLALEKDALAIKVMELQ
mgnify:CR=1 FL=1